MSYGVALRNGVPFTLGTIAALCTNATTQWNPLSLWPDGIDSPGMWISPRDLTSEWQDYTGTTPVAVPGTVADSSNPVGLALDIRAGAPEVLGPELVVNGDGSSTTGWVLYGGTGSISVVSGRLRFTSAGTLNTGIMQTVTGLTVGTTYQYEVTLVTLSNPSTYIYLPAGAGFPGGGGFNVITTYQFAFVANATSFDLVVRFAGAAEQPGDYFEVDNISVKEVPGNHMLQSTSAARPLMSARRNLLTYTEDLSNAAWNKRGFGSPVSGQTDPLGGTTAFLITENDTDTNPAIIGTIATLAADVPQTYGVFLKATSPTTVNLSTNGIYVGSTVSLTTAWQFFEVTQTSSGTYGPHIGGFSSITRGSGIGIYVWHPQYELGTTATDYQSVPGNGSTYATDFPIYQKYDGVDDGMATATFTAGTLINGMDCMIAVRRDSAAQCIAGLFTQYPEKFFGVPESGSSTLTYNACGTPTVWVDGVQLAGGTAVTRDTLHTALTVGDYHILEFRGLDLSTWTSAGFGLYTGYVFPGARGDIMLFDSTASTEDKDAARQYLADYYGVTLP